MINILVPGEGYVQHWWPTSAHARYAFKQSMNATYQYDAADNGPECEIIMRILASHPAYRPSAESV